MTMNPQANESGQPPQDHEDPEEHVPPSHELSEAEEVDFDVDIAKEDSPVMVDPTPPSHTSTIRTPEDSKKIWGGRMVDSVIAHEGNLSLFSDDCLAIHGLYSAFYSRNGWGRTLVYLGFWLLVGCFFAYLTVPLVNDYGKKTVSTSVDFEEGTTVGLPLPIITVCPHASGDRCDCLLWRKIYCRYLEDIPNAEWRNRFVSYTCLSQFQRTEEGDLLWVDPQCDRLDNETDPLVDPCLPSQAEILKFPVLGNVTTERLFETVIERENSTDGPYISYGEVALYASHRVEALFYRGASNPLRNLKSATLPREWINEFYLEPSRRQICTQFRAPFSEKQTMAGASNGINVIVTQLTTDLYPLQDFEMATPAVDIHVNVAHADMYGDDIFYVEPHTYTPVSAGMVTAISYKAADFVRVKGWGAIESRVCSDTKIPRASCIRNTILSRAGEQCACTKPETYSPAFDVFGESSVYWCSSSFGTPQNDCVEDVVAGVNSVSLDQCPVQCRSTLAQLANVIQTTLSEPQTEFIRTMHEVLTPSVRADSPIVREESAVIQVGVASLHRNKYEQSPKVALAALLGQVGGNAGLWCGLSFVMALETLEFLVVALLYGGGFYTGGRSNHERIKRAVRRHP